LRILAVQGLQQHIEASHDLFDFGYSQGEADVVPTVNVRCPGELYDRQGTLQNPEADDIGDGTDCKVSALFHIISEIVLILLRVLLLPLSSWIMTLLAQGSIVYITH